MTASACERLRGYAIIAKVWWLSATRRGDDGSDL